MSTYKSKWDDQITLWRDPASTISTATGRLTYRQWCCQLVAQINKDKGRRAFIRERQDGLICVWEGE